MGFCNENRDCDGAVGIQEQSSALAKPIPLLNQITFTACLFCRVGLFIVLIVVLQKH